jgi:hypothetical protein
MVVTAAAARLAEPDPSGASRKRSRSWAATASQVAPESETVQQDERRTAPCRRQCTEALPISVVLDGQVRHVHAVVSWSCSSCARRCRPDDARETRRTQVPCRQVPRLAQIEYRRDFGSSSTSAPEARSSRTR